MDLRTALDLLANTGIGRLLVEGGGTIVEALLRDSLVDEIELFVAPVILGGRDAPTPVAGLGFSIDDAVRLQLLGSSVLTDGGLVLRYRVIHIGGAARNATLPAKEMQ